MAHVYRDTLLQAINVTRDNHLAITKAFEDESIAIEKHRATKICRDFGRKVCELEVKYRHYLNA